MTNLYETDLQQIIEYKEATEKQKAEKRALKLTIAAILGSFALGGIAMIASKEHEKGKDETVIEQEEDIEINNFTR